MKKKKNKVKLPRDWNAVNAHFRNSGFMKDRREDRGGTRNSRRELIDDYYHDQEMENRGIDIIDDNYISCSDNFDDDDCQRVQIHSGDNDQ